jgi:excisionase family DNA binding protein
MELLTIADTAKLLKVTPTTVRRHIAAGRLAAVKVGGVVRVRREALDDLLSPVSTRRPAAHAPGNGAPMVQAERFVARPLTEPEKQRMFDAIEQSRRYQEKLRAKYGAQPVEPGWKLLDEARGERTRELA